MMALALMLSISGAGTLHRLSGGLEVRDFADEPKEVFKDAISDSQLVEIIADSSVRLAEGEAEASLGSPMENVLGEC